MNIIFHSCSQILHHGPSFWFIQAAITTQNWVLAWRTILSKTLILETVLEMIYCLWLCAMAHVHTSKIKHFQMSNPACSKLSWRHAMLFLWGIFQTFEDVVKHRAGGIQTYFLWLSVSVMPWEDTLKCTTVAVGGEVAASVSDMALATAWGPVRDSISTELM